MFSLLNSHTQRCFPFTKFHQRSQTVPWPGLKFGEDKNHFHTYAILRFQAHSYELLKILSLGCQPLGRRDQSLGSPRDPLTLTELQIPPAPGSLMRTEVFVYSEKNPSILSLHSGGIIFYCLFAKILRMYKLGSMYILHVLDHFENCPNVKVFHVYTLYLCQVFLL